MDALDALKGSGLSQNEARAYLTLLRRGPMNGYEAAKQSRITRTMIYDVLKRLCAKGFVYEVPGDTTLYRAADYRDILGRLDQAHKDRMGTLQASLRQAEAEGPGAEFVYNLRGGSRQLMMQLQSQLAQAQRDVFLSLWGTEAALIQDSLRQAHDRGVALYLFSFSVLPFSFGNQFCYNVEDGSARNLSEQFPCRRVTAVFDGGLLLAGTADSRDGEISIMTRNAMLVEMALDQIKLDILHLRAFRQFCGDPGRMSAQEYAACKARYLDGLGIPEGFPGRIRNR